MKKMLLLGYGKSNQSLYQLVKDKYEVYIYDDFIKEEHYYSLKRLQNELPLFDIVIRSPGINTKSEVYHLARMLTKEMLSEIEYCFRYLNDKSLTYILISGTNGKTTLATLVYDLVKLKYPNCFLGGNIGIPFSSFVDQVNDGDFIILELSSYQLEDTYSPVGDYIILTNISPNHLDGVVSLDTYIASKKRLNLLKTATGKLIISDTIVKYFKDESPHIVKTSMKGYREIFKPYLLLLARELNIDPNFVDKVIQNAYLPPFRNQVIKSKYRAIIINDSKSTTVESLKLCLALHSNKRRIIIIGGIYKSEGIENVIFNEDDLIYLFGKSANYLATKIKNAVIKSNLEEIISDIKPNLNEDIYILFSPGCSSFDQYENYLKRGEHFNSLFIGEEDENR